MIAVPRRGGWYGGLATREPMEAASAASLLMAVGALLLFVKNASAQLMFGSPEPDGRVVSTLEFTLTTIVVPISVLLIAAAIRRSRVAGAPYTGLAAALTMVILLTVVIVGSGDDSAGAQIFFVLPVIWSAFYLRPLGFVVVALAAAAAMVVIAQAVTTGGIAGGGALFLIASILTAGVLIFRERRAADVMEELLEVQANTDGLTGLATRRVLDAALADRLASEEARDLSLLVIDIDHFKSVNDSGGHATGDAALRAIGALIGRAAAPGDVACRMGGDEFARRVSGARRDEVHRVAEDIGREVREISGPAGSGVSGDGALSVSIGVAHAPQDATDVAALYEAADRRLYVAKARGRGCVVVVDRAE